MVGLLAGCTGDDDERAHTTDGPATTDSSDDNDDVPVTIDGVPVTPSDDDTQATPLGLRLSEGHASTTPADLLAVLEGSPLTADEIAAVLARLPEWIVPADDVEPFNRPRPLPPDLREEMRAVFAPEIAKLEQLLGRDLGHWGRS